MSSSSNPLGEAHLTRLTREMMIDLVGFQSQCGVMRKTHHEAIIFFQKNRNSKSEINRRLFSLRRFSLEPPRERFYQVDFAASFSSRRTGLPNAMMRVRGGRRRVSWPTGANKLFPSNQFRKRGVAKRAHESGVDSAIGELLQSLAYPMEMSVIHSC